MPLSGTSSCIALVLLATVSLLSASDEPTIKVGTNVQVSAANAELQHWEPVVDVDPGDPQHLLACSLARGPEPDNELFSIAYVSFDGGRGWQESHREKAVHPSCAFGKGAAYLTVEGHVSPLYVSKDGARSWAKTATYPSSDHPYLNVDNTSPAFPGQVYISARNADPQGHTGVTLYSFSKEGKSLDVPVSLYSAGDHFTPIMGSAAVMKDGTYALIFPELMKSPSGDVSEYRSEAKNAWIKFSVSRDGGKTLEPPSTVTTINWNSEARSPALQFVVATDTSSGPFQNRLYVAWMEKQLGRYQIWLSHSDDIGKTWSEPVTVDDGVPRTPPAQGPNSLEPAVSVNDRGVVGVLWYDRRDVPDDLGWYARFSASLDGGETFLPSARVSIAPMSFTGRHRATFNYHFDKSVADSAYVASYTVGFAGGPDGVFHAVWVDNRTGNWQLWTAPISVSGAAVRNGSTELSVLKDVSSDAPVHIGSPFFDWSTGEFECDLYVKNVSSKPLAGPLKLRVLRIESDVGIVKDTKIGEHAFQPHSAFDVSSEALMPGQWSKPLHVSGHVSILFGPHDAHAEERLQRIFTIDSKTLAATGWDK